MNQQDGGVATETPAAEAGKRRIIDDANFRRLQELRRGTAFSANGDGYLAAMLVNRAGWTPEQTATFLGLDQTATNLWLATFSQSGLVALADLPAPRPAAL